MWVREEVGRKDEGFEELHIISMGVKEGGLEVGKRWV